MPAHTTGMVAFIRRRAWSVLLIASLLALWSGPLLATSPHEVCQAMHHACDKFEAVATCCCGDRSDGTPSPTASDRSDGVADPTHLLAVFSPAVVALPRLTVSFVHGGWTPVGAPPNLPVLLSDLRL